MDPDPPPSIDGLLPDYMVRAILHNLKIALSYRSVPAYRLQHRRHWPVILWRRLLGKRQDLDVLIGQTYLYSLKARSYWWSFICLPSPDEPVRNLGLRTALERYGHDHRLEVLSAREIMGSNHD